MKYKAQILVVEGDIQTGFSVTGDVANEFEFECPEDMLWDIETYFKSAASAEGIKLPAITVVKMENTVGPYWHVAHTINGANQQLPIAQFSRA